jgi:hypothetical protein
VSYKKLLISLATVTMLVACSSTSGKLGSYIASDDDAAFMVQITSMENGQVKGSMSVVMADESGKTTAATRPMSGTIEGNALNLSVENGTGLSLATGTIEDDSLRLTFFAKGNSSQLKFAKSDASKFDELANATRHRAAEKGQEIESAAATKGRIEQRAKIQKSIDRLADAVFSKTQEVQEKVRKIDVVIAGYGSAHNRAEKMQGAKATIGSASPDAEYRASQIDYQLGSISNDMENMHNQVQNYMQSLNSFMADAASQSPQFLAECQADELLNCSRLSAGLQSLQTRYQQFRAGHDRENAAFKGKRL